MKTLKIIEKNMDTTININSGRQFELDFAKFLAILFMVLVHSFDYSTLGLEGTTSARGLIEFLGSPLAAPVFMFCMGIGMVYSRHNSPKEMFKRGLHLFAIGYLLNLYRTIIPLGTYFSGISSWSEAKPLFVAMLLCVDILPFAGLSFIFFAGVKRLSLKKWQAAFCVLALLLLSELVPKVGSDSFIPKYIIGLFAYQNEFTSFPLMQWLPFPMAGIIFGEYLKSTSNKERFYLITLAVGLILLIISTMVALSFGKVIKNFYTTTYLDMNLLQVIWTLGIVLIWIPILFFVSKVLKWEKIRSFITFCSKQINQLYIWHWIILVPVILLTYALYPIDNIWKLLLEFIFVFVLTYLIIKRLYNKENNKKLQL